MELVTKSTHNPAKVIFKPDLTELAVGIGAGAVIFKLPKELKGGTLFSPHCARSSVDVEVNVYGIDYVLHIFVFNTKISLEISYFDGDDMMHVLHEATATVGK